VRPPGSAGPNDPNDPNDSNNSNDSNDLGGLTYNEHTAMNPTDVGSPAYYHRVVDCQWACPAHTNVPEYIRLISHGRFTDAYLLNRESNVFPGILGRTCDRPCEPACRRTRVDGKPVAICRLKRVAADHRDEVKHLLPTAPAHKNGKKVALIGAGPASLTVANDLMPLGYQVTIFEKLSKPGGLMRINIPAFRLPEQVLDEEIGYIVDMGVDVRYNTPVESLKALLDSKEYDAVFVGSGAPKGKELEIPGRRDTDQTSWPYGRAREHARRVGSFARAPGQPHAP
jgi:NADPH-dependent glutamate synthase beta subunit-like oxidoreductase